MSFKRKKISPQYLYTAILTLQKKSPYDIIRKAIGRHEILGYLSCEYDMLSVALINLYKKGWIVRVQYPLYSVACVGDVPHAIDFSKDRISGFGFSQ